MREYLIKAIDGSGWIPIHVSKMPEVLLPAREATGAGEFNIQVENAIISFSAEDPGWHVCFEKGQMDPSRADALVDQVRAQIEAASGIPAFAVVITE